MAAGGGRVVVVSGGGECSGVAAAGPGIFYFYNFVFHTLAFSEILEMILLLLLLWKIMD